MCEVCNTLHDVTTPQTAIVYMNTFLCNFSINCSIHTKRSRQILNFDISLMEVWSLSELWRLCLCLHWATESSDETFFSYYHLQIVSMEFVVYEWFIETKYTVVYFPKINIKDRGVYQWYMMFGKCCKIVIFSIRH